MTSWLTYGSHKRAKKKPGQCPGFLLSHLHGSVKGVLRADGEVTADRAAEVQRVVIHAAVGGRVERGGAVEHVLHRGAQLEGCLLYTSDAADE